MVHEIIIWRKNKANGHHFVETRINMTDKDIESIALDKHKSEQFIDEENFEYFAEIDKTII